MGSVRIVTDSTSDLPQELATRLGVAVVPAYVQIGDRSYRDDGSGLDRQEFYARLPTMQAVPTTAVPPANEFAEAFRRLSDEAEEVIAIVISSNLSGMYSVARLGAQSVPQVKVHVVDSGQVTMGLGWIVAAAAEAAAEGRSGPEILALIEDLKPRVCVYATLDTLEYLRRSGRVSWARARAAQVLRIKPIVQVAKGTVSDVGRTRTRRRAIDRLLELTRALGPLERLAILHTYAPEVEDVRARIRALGLPRQPIDVAVTTIIGTHVGPRALGVAAVVGST